MPPPCVAVRGIGGAQGLAEDHRHAFMTQYAACVADAAPGGGAAALKRGAPAADERQPPAKKRHRSAKAT